MSDTAAGTFRSLRNPNYRLWATGSLVSNIGGWMQRTAQDWLVLTELTPHNATAVGTVMALQFGPQLLLLPFTGFVADRYDRRRIMIVTQCLMALLAFGLGALTLAGAARLWHVYVFALALGCVTAFDVPARQSFVSELVGDRDLPNAVALNSVSFNAARLVGPATAGLMIAAIGSGWLFVFNGVSFIAVLWSLLRLKLDALHGGKRTPAARGSLMDGVRYVRARPDLKALIAMQFLIGTFGLNFSIYISTMSVSIFHGDSRMFGALTSMLGIGAVTGALLSARRARPSIGVALVGCSAFALVGLLAAVAPNYVFFSLTLVALGICAQTINTTINSCIQLGTDPAMRGRVMAILFGFAFGGTPFGAPLVGWVADTFGARFATGVTAAAGLSAALVTVHYYVRHRNLRLVRVEGRLRLRLDPITPLP